MLGSSNRSVSKQLSTALETISEHEFPQHWPELLPVRRSISFICLCDVLLENHVYFLNDREFVFSSISI